MNLFTKQKETQQTEDKLVVNKGEGEGRDKSGVWD